MKMHQLLAWLSTRIGKPPGWERVVRRLASPESCAALGELCMVREDIAVFANPGVLIGWHIAFFGTYEPELRSIFRSVLKPGGIAVDVGANIGWHTLLMASLVGPEGRVLAAEVNPSVRERLQANVQLNQFSQIVILPYAIANTKGTLPFWAPSADDPNSGNGFVERDAQIREGLIEVEARPLDELISDAGLEQVNLLKVDVEGFEWPVFEGAESTIVDFRPHVVFEYDSAYAARGGGSVALLAKFFQRHRYRLFTVGRSWSEPLSERTWPSCANIWAIPQ